jgi:predicted RNase H-like HicB family nuclease
MADITFHVVIHDEPDGSLWSEVKELPGCFASGFDMDELQEATVEAIQLWLPKGIDLGEASWKLSDEGGRGGTPKKPATKRTALVCA